LAGAAIMSDGRPGFLLDTGVLAGLAHDSRFAVRPAGPPKSLRRKSVLVVDDSLTTRMLEKAVLGAAGYRILMACDGPEALELLAQKPCDLVVIDYEMPGMNGLELARAIQENPQTSDIPLMMLTSWGRDEDRRRGLAAGMRAYLVKGQFDQTVFLDTVQGLIGDAEDES
jgi:two-component system chemotaxis sensor kinase CheA